MIRNWIHIEKEKVEGLYRITRNRLETREIKLKNFTYYSCSIINISINTHEINSCPRGEIGRHKGLKID